MSEQKQSQDGIPAYNPTEYHSYGTNEPLASHPVPQQQQQQQAPLTTSTDEKQHPINYPPPPDAPPAYNQSTSYPPPPAGAPPASSYYPYPQQDQQQQQQHESPINYPPPPAQASGGLSPEHHDDVPPPRPPRPTQSSTSSLTLSGSVDTSHYPAPPTRLAQTYGDDDLSNPIHYTRDPHKLIAYLVPFPKPNLPNVDPATLPTRFLIYTPPPPPLKKPAEGEKESKLHKVQRKWQEELKSAKTSTAKTASWKGFKAKATRGISAAMDYTKTADLEFLNRVPDSEKSDQHAQDGAEESDDTHKTVGLEEMVLVYPNSLEQNPDQMRAEFVNSMLRSKSKAQRDAVIATGLLPVSAAIDILATVIWPFGGLLEIDSVWAYSSIRGAKISRSVTKRLSSTGSSADQEKNTLHLNFVPAARMEILRKYLAAECHKYDPKLFPSVGGNPTETDVLAAIGWQPSQTGGETKNWEDEQWEMSEVKDDVRQMMHKGAREWAKWSKEFAKAPEKALKK